MVNTTAPPPRLRAKGVQNEVMYKRTIQIGHFFRRGWWEFLVRVRVALASSIRERLLPPVHGGGAPGSLREDEHHEVPVPLASCEIHDFYDLPKSASRVFEPTRDFSGLFTGLSRW